jgi:cell division protein FtsB
MAIVSRRHTEKNDIVNKQVTLTVAPQGPDDQDIRVEITRSISLKKRRGQRRFTVFLFIIMALMVFPIARDIYAQIKMKEEYKQLLDYNKELRAVTKRLESELELYNSPEMVERLAREELDMVMPGESKVYQAIPTDDIPRRETLKKDEVLH